MLTRLCVLGKKYGTDKYPWYTAFYDSILRSLSVKTVLEIGILDGASLRMWRDYFPEAHVYGMDANAQTLFTEERIRTYCGNQRSIEDLRCVATECGPFDLIVDDASHAISDQINTARFLLDYLRPGGLYIIEDVNAMCAVSQALHDYVHTEVRTHSPDGELVGRGIVIQVGVRAPSTTLVIPFPLTGNTSITIPLTGIGGITYGG